MTEANHPHPPDPGGQPGPRNMGDLDDATLERIERAVRGRPEYWAWVLERYRQLQGSGSDDLPRHLGVSPHDLLRLSLFLRPRPGRFQQDVTQAAVAFGIDRFRLADVARFVDNVEAMRMPGGGAAPQQSGTGFLLAARRRPKPGEEGDDKVTR